MFVFDNTKINDCFLLYWGIWAGGEYDACLKGDVDFRQALCLCIMAGVVVF